jgi:hypothetical protein
MHPKISEVISLFIREVVLSVYQIPDDSPILLGVVFDGKEFQRI